ncbi:hypothetical protein LR48_Vigan432s000100 [Vigna angularis]|uniref:Uncharacterized protein n=1 Tax=Phaseolus angularis TaxID=3914 RepID=A0A0L9TAU4_PHAAN|nr:hypothetical protein LR48_Vigan432s000100 [Vigna angularis]
MATGDTSTFNHNPSLHPYAHMLLVTAHPPYSPINTNTLYTAKHSFPIFTHPRIYP